jgi:hypothetical protein
MKEIAIRLGLVLTGVPLAMILENLLNGSAWRVLLHGHGAVYAVLSLVLIVIGANIGYEWRTKSNGRASRRHIGDWSEGVILGIAGIVLGVVFTPNLGSIPHIAFPIVSAFVLGLTILYRKAV